MNQKVNTYIENNQQWQQEIIQLRELLLDCQLDEDFKWRSPCYTHKNKNIVLIHVFKEYCALLFFKGALLKDSEGILIQQTKNVQAARQIRFTSKKEIIELTASIKAYVYEAIEVEKAGLKIPLKKTSEFEMPEEFRIQLKESTELQKAFKKLTPGRQRGYLLYFSGAKQSSTRISRIEKSLADIFAGKGLRD